MKIESIALTDSGRVRRNNEDNFFLCGKIKEDTETTSLECACNEQSDTYLFGVCDGMGGAQYGELASLIAVKSMLMCQKQFDSLYTECISTANTQICREIERRDVKRIGTTFAALSIRGGIARAYNIGDSRIYLNRGNELSQISVDHTLVQMLVNQGIITKEEAKTHRDRHIITQHLGIFPEEMLLEPYAAEPLTIADGDIFLLCSDGLTDMVDDNKICEILSADDTLENKAHTLLDTALTNGGRDNVTLVLVGASESKTDFDRIESKLRNNMNAQGDANKEKLINELMEKIRTKIQ